jgi:hypothetical protein
MPIVFTGVLVRVTRGKYKGKTGRIHSYTQKTCTLIDDADSTTIGEMTGALSGQLGPPTGRIPLKNIITLDWRTPPSMYFMASLDTLIHTSLMDYCSEKFPGYMLARGREVRGDDPEPNDPPRSLVPVYEKFSKQGDPNDTDQWTKKWRAEFWTLYCDAFYDRKPEEALKIQALTRMYLQHKKYLEILSLKPGGKGYMKAKIEFECGKRRLLSQ